MNPTPKTAYVSVYPKIVYSTSVHDRRFYARNAVQAARIAAVAYFKSHDQTRKKVIIPIILRKVKTSKYHVVEITRKQLKTPIVIQERGITINYKLIAKKRECWNELAALLRLNVISPSDEHFLKHVRSFFKSKDDNALILC